eukprot:3892120-Rhodomonas_salina.1
MTSLIKCSPNPKDPIHSSFALTTVNELVWTAEQTKCITVPPAFSTALLPEAHDSPISSHRGTEKMYGALAEIYYWPAMFKDVHAYCVTCESCASNKQRNHSAP